MVDEYFHGGPYADHDTEACEASSYKIYPIGVVLEGLGLQERGSSPPPLVMT